MGNRGVRIILGLVILGCVFTQIGVYNWSSRDGESIIRSDNEDAQGDLVLRNRHIEQVEDHGEVSLNEDGEIDVDMYPLKRPSKHL